MFDLNSVLGSFENVKRTGDNKWVARCPCHDDKTNSLSIGIGKNKSGKDIVVLKCFAGCPTSDILGIVGLQWSDLGSGSKKADFSLWEKIAFGQKQFYGENTEVKDHYDYTDKYGNYLYTKVRFEGGDFGGDKKLIRYYRIDYPNQTFEPGKGDQEPTLYQLPKLLQAIADGYPVNIVEGEKDVKTLEKLGWTATTAGSASDWKSRYAKYFKGADVRIFPDNDKAGAQAVESIMKDILKYACKVKIVYTSASEKGDVTDYLNEPQNNKETLNTLISRADPKYANWIDANKKGDTTINVDKLSRNINKNEEYLIARNTDGLGEHLYVYEHGVYLPASAAIMKGVISKYYPIGKATPTSLDNVYKLLLCRGDHFCSSEELNKDESIINLQNGILNIKTMRLTKHSPDIKSTCQLQFKYEETAHKMPNFDKYINDLCLDADKVIDKDKKAVIQEMMGLVLSNVYGYRVKKAGLLYSPCGNSGKSQLINLLQAMLGLDRVVTIPLQDMNPANRFALANLPSARLITCGDQTASRVSDSSIFKQLTGSDMVKVEGKGKDAINFIYKGFLLYGCNALPVFEDDKGDHLFERLLLIPCINTIKSSERDTKLLDKMLTEKSAIFNWAMVGLKRLIENNYEFTQCKAITTAVDDFRQKIDSVKRFLDERNYIVTCDTSDTVNAQSLFDEYQQWCNEEENEIIYPIKKKSNFRDRLESFGIIYKKSSSMVYAGIKYLGENGSFDWEKTDEGHEIFQ